MLRTYYRIVVGSVLVVTMTAGCGGAVSSTTPESSRTSGTSTTPASPAGAPVTLVALGDSLTAGEGDDSGLGYAGRLAETIAAQPTRADSTLVNLGQSGWDSTMLVNGQDGGTPDERWCGRLLQSAARGRLRQDGARMTDEPGRDHAEVTAGCSRGLCVGRARRT